MCHNELPVEVHSVPLRSGLLRLRVHRADRPLDELCGFASRRSRKRGFVFVSKVLGKHYPVRPRVMHQTHQALAARLHDLPGPVVVLALAETATGLGQGVYERLWHGTGRTDLLFLHSTRYHLRRPLALQFDEAHSHATEHRVYEPADPEDCRLFHQAAALVLVDDEISTGRTLANLARAFRRQHPALRAVHLVCLTDWLSPECRAEIHQTVDLPLTIHSLLHGDFQFTADATFDPGPIPQVVGNGGAKDAILPRISGRLGMRGPRELPGHVRRHIDVIAPGTRVLVLGTGEFAYPPFRLALELEERGCEVYYQSTTRSPLLVERDLQSVLEFPDNYDDEIPNFVYNVLGRTYDQVLIGYETRPVPASHRLCEQLNARAVFFGDAEA